MSLTSSSEPTAEPSSSSSPPPPQRSTKKHVPSHSESLQSTPNLKPTPPLSHRAAADFLSAAHESGRLGSGPRELPLEGVSTFTLLVRTLPLRMLFVQLLWSGAVVAFAYALGDHSDGTLSIGKKPKSWQSKLNVSPSVSYGVGWALFVLLGFFIREASARFRDAQHTLAAVRAHLLGAVRMLRQAYPPGTWHPGDLDRIAAHLVAYPVALKMSLRGEREGAQLADILHPADVEDVLAADLLHLHCSRVVRAYFSCAEDDAHSTFHAADASKTPAGWGTRYFVIDVIDAIDFSANTAMRISRFRPSAAYVNHLRIFLYIWILFMPLSVVGTSGWFTPLFTVLITYGIGMLFDIALALNDPYGFDLQDVKLNRLCAKMAHDVLVDYTNVKMELEQVIVRDHHTPDWLERDYVDADVNGSKTKRPACSQTRILAMLKRVRTSRTVVIGLFLFTLWTAFIVLGSWALTRNDARGTGVRWWQLYIPLSTSTTSYVSLGIFLLIGFWLNAGYGRYWSGLQLWQTTLPTKLSEIIFRFGVLCERGCWHPRDRERLFSFMAALPFLATAHLRGSRDLSAVEGILCPQDLISLQEAPNLPAYAFHVIYGYLNSVDKSDQATFVGKNPFGATVYAIQYGLWAMEGVLLHCDNLRSFPISPSFTLHLSVFTCIWLMLLPLTVVEHAGFISFAYMLPIGYSIINLLVIGRMMSDPFGTDDYDIPLHTFSEGLKQSVHRIYQDTRNGARDFVHGLDYSRSCFQPQRLNTSSGADPTVPLLSKPSSTRTPDSTPTLVGSLRTLFNVLPSVPPLAQIVATLWSVAAVTISWALSKRWDGDRQKDCREWCSPIDVESSILSKVAFGLFLILAFRAADAISRYQEGAMHLFNIGQNLRAAVVTFVMGMRDDWYHRGDKERFVAHAVQIPLCLRDELLGRQPGVKVEGLLVEEDRAKVDASAAPLDHLLQTLEAYLLIHDSSTREGFDLPDESLPPNLRNETLMYLTTVRKLISSITAVKKFPVIRNYTDHQHVFTGIWLMLLPLSMTSDSGWFTILWAPLISFGVFGLESIAAKLVDPFGTDSIDLPVSDMCAEAADTILEAVGASEWGSYPALMESPVTAQPRLGTVLAMGTVEDKFSLAYVPREEDDLLGAKFGGPRQPRTRPTFFSHIIHSVPWLALLATSVWSAVACVVSYLARSKEGVWWESNFHVGSSVTTYVSIPTFTLLGFYVQVAFSRYNAAGAVWGDTLRANCHTLVSLFLSLFTEGAIHEGDHERIVGLIAAIPLVLKHELRGSRDLREVKGLLSVKDLARIQTAECMTTYITDLLRMYLKYSLTCRDHFRKESRKAGACKTFVLQTIRELQQAASDSIFYRDFPIAPGFTVLLNALLALWFVLLPFVLAESSGWFTIIWVPLIAYGLLGMRKVADELVIPYGADVNDLDLDEFADEIVADVLSVARQQKNGCWNLVQRTETQPFWLEAVSSNRSRRWTLFGDESDSQLKRLREDLHLAAQAVPLWLLAVVVAWSAVAVVISWGVGRAFPKACDSKWFCSYIAIDSSVKDYVGFALFLLLGFRLYDSHFRYVEALRIWQDGIIGFTRLLINRVLESYGAGQFHQGDVERICGHLGALAISSMAGLRKKSYAHKLREVLSEDDVQRVLSEREQVDHCAGVVRAYFTAAEKIEAEDAAHGSKKHGAGSNEHFALFYYLDRLVDTTLKCQRVVRIPLPFGYVQHLRIFLAIWVLIIPLSLVESTGWLTTLWIAFMAYGVIGIETWSEQLSDPFGEDVSDVPLDELCNRVLSVLKTNLHFFRDGIEGVVIRDRNGLPCHDQDL